ncbi:MAG: ABC transporter ATP-binding protein/permease [Phycisphaerales bacterium]|nr:ABC transporter ATP-binding protein/permease [Phycisphaerales bacterium]
MPSILPSSKSRFSDFLKARREDPKGGTKAGGGGAGAESGLASDTSRSSPKDDAKAKGDTGKSSEAKRDWTVDQPREKRKAQRSFWELVRRFAPLLKGHEGKFGVSIASVVIAALIALVTPIGAKITLDYAIAPGAAQLEQLERMGWSERRLELAWWIALISVGIVIISLIVGTIGRYQMTRLSKLLQSEVRRRVFGHLSTLPLHRLSSLKSGGVSSILRDDAGVVGEMLFSVMFNPLRAVITLVGGLGAMAILDWRLLVGGVSLLPAVWFTHRTWISRIRPVYTTIKQNRTTADAQATEAFAGMRIVRAFDRRRGESSRFTKNNHLMARQEMFVWWWSRAIESLWMLLIPSATAVGLAYGASQVMNGRLTIGDIGAFLTYLGMILGPMELLVGTASQLQNGLAGWDRCLDVLDEPTEFDSAKAGLVASGAAGAGVGAIAAGTALGAAVVTPVLVDLNRADVRGEVRLRNVSFTYPRQTEPVLSDINLHVPAGTMVALVGASGSGKTTLCNLVARFFDPSSGTIELDGVDLRRVNVESYRRLLGIVEQDVFLFDGTVADNIAYADRSASMERVIEAARAANAEEFIVGLDKQYETVIGERGVRLSGGQKQRIAIARALLADPKILILDEATSSLDTRSERLIQGSLSTLMKGRTSFVIAHRLSTVRDAGVIVVLEKGRVVEMGTHDELQERRGAYYSMLQIQLHAAKDYAI